MGNKKLVLGATGFIGSAVMRELLKDGNDVKVVLRKAATHRISIRLTSSVYMPI